MTDIRTLHRSADLELADEGGIAPLEVENARSFGRHGEAWDGVPRAEEKYPLWPVVLGLVCFWVGVIVLVRGCA